MKLGVVDVGGGLRGIYAAGIFDYCMDMHIRFDLCIGVSAGSANLCSYVAGQRGRNFTFYTQYAFRRQYMGLGNFLSKRSYVDLDYVYSTLSNSDGENPLDYPAFAANPAEFQVVATNALNGDATYFSKSDICQDGYDPLKASSAIPVVCRPYIIKGIPYYDGALSDPVPVERAFALGCDKVVVILTRPRDYVKNPEADCKAAKRIQKPYPLAAKRLRERTRLYNQGVALAKEYEAQGRALILAPDDTSGLSTLTKDREALIRLYNKGYRDAKAILAL